MADLGLTGRRVLVTGGTGFIGGRLVAKLVGEHGAEVRVLVRRFSSTARLARFPVELVQGDLRDAAAVASAARDCPFVFNCAYGSDGDAEAQRAVNVEGTRHILEADPGSSPRERVVHLSTVSVYGEARDGVLDESAPSRPSGGVYSDTKLESEELVLRNARAHGFPGTVLQPTLVYGPFAPSWTVRVLREMRSHRVILVDGGGGLCNPVYVDDVVDAMLLAAVRKEAVGERFLVSGPQPVTWREFFRRHEEMLGEPSTVDLSARDALALQRRATKRRLFLAELLAAVRESPTIRERLRGTWEVRLARKLGALLVPGRLRRRRAAAPGTRGATSSAAPQALHPTEPKPVQALSPGQVRFYAAKPSVSIRKARDLLGYAPAFDFAAGTRRTEQWARWARLAPSG